MTREADKQAFLAALVRLRSISAAAEAARVPRSTLYDWRRHDEAFAAAYAEAKAQIADDLEAELLRRAMAGQGQMPDTLGIFLLKGYKPEFRDTFRHEVTSVSVTANLNLDELTPGERVALLRAALAGEERRALAPEPAAEA